MQYKVALKRNCFLCGHWWGWCKHRFAGRIFVFSAITARVSATAFNLSAGCWRHAYDRGRWQYHLANFIGEQKMHRLYSSFLNVRAGVCPACEGFFCQSVAEFRGIWMMATLGFAGHTERILRCMVTRFWLLMQSITSIRSRRILVCWIAFR